MWWLRPLGLSVEDDVRGPAFSLFAVCWAIAFVQLWRRRQTEVKLRRRPTQDCASALLPGVPITSHHCLLILGPSLIPPPQLNFKWTGGEGGPAE